MTEFRCMHCGTTSPWGHHPKCKSTEKAANPHDQAPPAQIAEDLLAGFERNAEAWEEDPDALEAFLKRGLLVSLQISDYTMRHPPGGRSGHMARDRAQKEFLKTAEGLLEAIHAKRMKKAEKSANPAKG